MKKTQWEIVLEMLRVHPVTTKDIFERWIMAPQKVIEVLRKKGYTILTEPIDGKKHCKYTLIPTSEQLGLF